MRSFFSKCDFNCLNILFVCSEFLEKCTQGILVFALLDRAFIKLYLIYRVYGIASQVMIHR